MTAHRSYTCNLCRDTLKPPDGPYAKEGFGVHFDVGGASVFKRVSECENHICLQCARCVHDELRKVTPAEEPPR
jgi:hypothetical protein